MNLVMQPPAKLKPICHLEATEKPPSPIRRLQARLAQQVHFGGAPRCRHDEKTTQRSATALTSLSPKPGTSELTREAPLFIKIPSMSPSSSVPVMVCRDAPHSRPRVGLIYVEVDGLLSGRPSELSTVIQTASWTAPLPYSVAILSGSDGNQHLPVSSDPSRRHLN